jgi:cell division protein FtsL
MSFRVVDRQNEDLRSNATRLESEIRTKDGEISASQKEVVKYKELLEIANRENTQLNDGISKRELQRQVSFPCSPCQPLQSLSFLCRLQ